MIKEYFIQKWHEKTGAWHQLAMHDDFEFIYEKFHDHAKNDKDTLHRIVSSGGRVVCQIRANPDHPRGDKL